MKPIRYVSTRDASKPFSLSEAIALGLAPDGGLFVPSHFPRFSAGDYGKSLEHFFTGEESIVDIAERVLAPFFEGDPLAPKLGEICRDAFSFPIPLVELNDKGGSSKVALNSNGTACLELYHGPTAAFKDVGARFLAACFARMDAVPRTILVATSGDTGGAVAAAFDGHKNIRVAVFFPKGGVSALQERQLTCWSDNILSLRVKGTFDSCQSLVKQAFADGDLRKRKNLTSANSINIARLLPQMVYYAAASIWYKRRHNHAPAFAIPSGNIGNACGALWAREIGFPIRHVSFATNANRVIPDYFIDGKLTPRPSLKTLANAMDVGNPSNMERVLNLYPNLSDLSGWTDSLSVSDDVIQKIIVEGVKRWGRVWCPHTATAASVREQSRSDHWIIVATAHPAKFADVIEPLIGRKVDMPPSLSALLNRPVKCVDISDSLEALKNELK